MSTGGKVVVKEKTKKKNRTVFWSAECKYPAVLDRATELDWKSVDDDKQQGKVNLFWIDVATIHEHFRTIQPWQCINHFPGMPNVARKNKMGQNLNKLLKVFPKEYSFYPRTWILPGEMADFRNQFDNNGNSIGNKIYIIKPDAGCQGRGIYLTKTFDKVPLNENVVAQLYIKKPLLIDGYKFDLRIYCFVASVKPLRVYLFQDGLVRMCTQEYVKPTAKNLDQSCMHLTNYAVNKHNDNFQQPDDDDGDSGSKRSLQWFMDWIREEHGNDKADWLWKRMGTIIMRTLLSIIPILSREYDQHFKSFTGVPVDIRKIHTSTTGSNGYSASQPTGNGSTGSGSEGVGAASRGGRMQSRSNSFKQREQSQEREQHAATTDDENTRKEQNPTNTSTTNGDQQESENESEETGPQLRGSRCFEVLGYDIMLDSNLNPWIIEVNHLPSFSTDSPMDKDIKERLMEQVFSVLPVLPDDQQAYAAYHKAESEKRLVAQNRINALAKKEKEAKEREAKEKAAKPPRRPLRRDPTKSVDNTSNLTDPSNKNSENDYKNQDNNSNNTTIGTTLGGGSGSVIETQNGSDEEDSSENCDEECSPERLLEIKTILFEIYSKYSQEKLNKIDRLLAKYVTHEEEFLRFVLNKYNVDPKMYKSKIKKSKSATNTPRGSSTSTDGNNNPMVRTGIGENITGESPLLSSTDGIASSPVPTENAADLTGEEGEDEHEQSQEQSQEEEGLHTADEGETTEKDDAGGVGSLHIDTHGGNLTARGGPKTDSITSSSSSSTANRTHTRDGAKRVSRSMSPPRSSLPHAATASSNAPASNRRAAAAWKVSSEEEDAKFKAEVLAVHVPKEDDEWLLYETAKLTQFTRLYPPLTPTAIDTHLQATTNTAGTATNAADIAAAAAEALEVEVQGEDDDQEDDQEEGRDASATRDSTGSAVKGAKEKVKAVTYEEIIFQAFLQDRRQTMRMHQPLRPRVVTDDNVGNSSFLPPLDGASRSNFSTINSNGKGAVGWKAPPKPSRDAVVRQPTQLQSDAAKRLSQGLSVANVSHTARQRYVTQNHLNMPSALASTGYSVVLDPHEYQQMHTSSSGVGAAASGSNGSGSVVQTGGQQVSNAYLPIYGGVFPTFNGESKPEAVWPSTKANRLLEESRINRMRLEAAKANSAAVVRQQVFYFDPNYRDQLTAISADGLTLIPPGVGSNGSILGGGNNATAGSGSVEGHADVGNNDGSAYRGGQQTRVPPNNVSSALGAASQQGVASVKMPAVVASAGTGVVASSGSMKVRPAPAIGQVRHLSTGNIPSTLHSSHQAQASTNANHSQEELLRQLFPSWF